METPCLRWSPRRTPSGAAAPARRRRPDPPACRGARSSLHPRRAAPNQGFDLVEGGHGSVARRGHRQRAVGGAASTAHCGGGRKGGHRSVPRRMSRRRRRGRRSPGPAGARLVKLAVGVADGAPVVALAVPAAQRGGDHGDAETAQHLSIIAAKLSRSLRLSSTPGDLEAERRAKSPLRCRSSHPPAVRCARLTSCAFCCRRWLAKARRGS